MSLHSDTLFWFRSNKSLFLLLNAACLTEKQQIPILQSLVWLDQGSNPRSTALEASMLTITPQMRSDKNEITSVFVFTTFNLDTFQLFH